MVRVFIVYEAAPDAERYAEHIELCHQVEGATFRHGPVLGSPLGEAKFAYYAEFEFPDLDAFKAASRSPEFGATAADATAMGIPFHVHFAEVSE